jgi:hypothetical protein
VLAHVTQDAEFLLVQPRDRGLRTDVGDLLGAAAFPYGAAIFSEY